MSYKKNDRKSVIKRSCILCSALICLGGTPSYAQNSDLSRDNLMGLAKEFVTRIGDGFEQADARPEEILSPQFATSNRIADGEELVLQLLAGPNKIPLNYDIIAIKQSYGTDILLEEFFGAVDFPIFVNPDEGTAEGWFIRENQTFSLNLPENTVLVNGIEYEIEPDEVFELDGELYAQSPALEKWFNLHFVYNFEELRARIYSAQPLPAEERYARENRSGDSYTYINDPVLPFEELEYSAYDIPFFDVNLQSSYFRIQNSDPVIQNRYSIIGAGDIAFLNANTFISGDNDDNISTIRAKFDRESLEPDLLGPLKARYFSFGDIDATPLELSSRSVQEQGVRVTNQLERRQSGFDTTFFRGNAQPGWDAELYRDERIVASQQIGPDGQYEFLDVPLFLGANNFRIILYGPQGEIREITESVPVNENSFDSGETFYDVSLTRNGEVTYQANRIDRPQDGTPTLTARVERGLSQNLSGFMGILSRDEGDTRRNYLESGFSTYVQDTFLDVNAGYETSEGEFGGSVTARRNFGENSARASVYAATNGFQPDPFDDNNPVVVRADAQINGPAKNFFGLSSSSYSLTSNYQKFALGNDTTNATASYTTRVRNNIVNTALSYNDRTDLNGDSDSVLDYTTNLRGFFKGGFYRLGSNFNVFPDTQLRSLLASYNYPFTNDVDGLVEIDHNLDPSLTRFTGSLNWKTNSATISPRVVYDTDNTLQALLNVRFGVGYNPATSEFDVFNQRISSTGGVTARVFLDSNGNGIYDVGEELIEGAELDAVQANREILSDSEGIAFIPDLPEGLITDVKIERESFSDPFYISTNEGVSIRPRPGVVKEIEFPVVVAGEIDGTVELVERDGQTKLARQFKVHLYAPWGEIIQSTATAYDGFFVFIDVPPGIYYMVADYAAAERSGYQIPSPRRLVFKPDGSTYYDEKLSLVEGKPIDYTFTSNIEPNSRKNRKVLQSVGETSATLRIGPFASRLAATVAMLKVKRAQNYIRQTLNINDPLESLKRDPETKQFWVQAETGQGNVGEVETMCRELAQFEIPCQVNIFTRAYQDETTAFNPTETADSKG